MERNGSPSTVLKLWIKYVIVLLIFLLDMMRVQLYLNMCFHICYLCGQKKHVLFTRFRVYYQK